jgi:hypothetical protein
MPASVFGGKTSNEKLILESRISAIFIGAASLRIGLAVRC